MAIADDLLKLAQQASFYQSGGGKPSITDQLDSVFGSIEGIGKNLTDSAQSIQKIQQQKLVNDALKDAQTPARFLVGQSPKQTSNILNDAFTKEVPGETPDARIKRIQDTISSTDQSIRDQQNKYGDLNLDDLKKFNESNLEEAKTNIINSKSTQKVWMNPDTGERGVAGQAGYLPLDPDKAAALASKFGLQANDLSSKEGIASDKNTIEKQKLDLARQNSLQVAQRFKDVLAQNSDKAQQAYLAKLAGPALHALATATDADTINQNSQFLQQLAVSGQIPAVQAQSGPHMGRPQGQVSSPQAAIAPANNINAQVESKITTLNPRTQLLIRNRMANGVTAQQILQELNKP